MKGISGHFIVKQDSTYSYYLALNCYIKEIILYNGVWKQHNTEGIWT